MDGKDKNEEMLENIKNILKEKENEIMKFQINQNKLEDRINNLEQKKENILKENKRILGNIIFHMMYNIIMTLIIIIFVICFADKSQIMSKCYAFNSFFISLGIVVISVTGTFVLSKIKQKLKRNFNQKIITKISKQIKDKQNEIKHIINKQELLKKDITNIMNKLDNSEKVISEDKGDVEIIGVEKIINIYNVNEEKKIINIKRRIKNIN